jgi:hypothetical protein
LLEQLHECNMYSFFHKFAPILAWSVYAECIFTMLHFRLA